jgi:hypothetical protein
MRGERADHLAARTQDHRDWVSHLRGSSSMLKLDVALAIKIGGTMEAVAFCREIVGQCKDVDEAHRLLTILMNYMVHECK